MRRRGVVWWWMARAAAWGVALGAGAIASGQVELRRGESPPAGEVVRVDAQGVSWRTVAGEVVIGWDRVSKVDGAWREQAREFEGVADAVFRARVRLERGDEAGAEALLEGLLSSYAGRVGPTSALVGEGVLRCRLARGGQSTAIGPWLVWLAATPGGARRTLGIEPAPGTASVIDARTGLAPGLPPVFVAGPATRALARSGVLGETGGTPVPRQEGAGGTPVLQSLELARRMEAWYRLAAEFEVGSVGGAGPADAVGDDAGFELVAEIVRARVGDAATRREAREKLGRRLKQGAAAWQEAWIRVGIGRSLLRESDAEERWLGVAELMHVPARLEREVPYLTGVALAEASVELWNRGRPEAALRLKKELAEKFPGHPVLDGEALRVVVAKGRGNAAGEIGTGGAEKKE